ncbi:MAG: glycosyltransferase, partial [Anaerolineae bacterium]|nr:glycosyltransferase [Anaerolineae bacterium]NIN96726.1 glycosyltransferase [Anaerolineae bacterium]
MDADRLRDAVELSVVIPVLNEEDSVRMLHEDLARVLEDLGRSYEILFVDDGSTDHTFDVLSELVRDDDHLRVVRLRRNFGQTAALSAGFDHARGEVIVTMDGDLQNDPMDIPRLLQKVDDGYDVVSGWRVDRKDPFLTRRLPSLIANRLISVITGVKLHDYGCSLKAYRHEVVRNIRLYGEMHRFIPALASWMGIQVAELPVNP